MEAETAHQDSQETAPGREADEKLGGLTMG